jgi:hypothetical protein
MKKSERIKLLKILSNRELTTNPDGFVERLKEEGLDKINIQDNQGAKVALAKLIKVLSLQSFFDEIEIEEDNPEDDTSKDNMNMMNIWIKRLRGELV